MNDNGHSRNLIKIPRCIRRLDRTTAVMASARETEHLPFCLCLIWAKIKVVSVLNRS